MSSHWLQYSPGDISRILHLKLPEHRVNSSLFNAVNEHPLERLHWKAKSSLCALAVSNVRFTWWHFLISSYYLTVSNGHSLTALKSKEFTLCSGSFKCKIHLVTFLYIFLLVDCFKWALIDCKIHLVTFLDIFLLFDYFKWALIDHIEKQRVYSVL